MDSNTRRVKNKKDICIVCNKEFKHYTWDKQLYCSKECYYKLIKEKKPKHNCASCGEEIEVSKYRNTRNEEYYCNRDCYNKRRKISLKRLKRGTKYYDNLLNNSKCKCGVLDKYLLQIHHKDGNHNNNEPNNLEIVCANCHIKRHLKKDKKGNLIYNPKYLTINLE